MRQLSLLCLAVVFFALTAAGAVATKKPVEPDIEKSCQSFIKTKRYAYCIYHEKKSLNRDIVFYMHGAGGNENRWISYWKSVRDSWRTKRVPMPTVVSLSFGPIWLLASKGDSKMSGLLDYTVEQVMPKLEIAAAEFTGQKMRRRLIMGESMGGFNTAQLIMRHPKLFDRAAILCPVMHDHTPFVSKSELQEYANQNQTTLGLAIWETIMERLFFPTANAWMEAEPFAAAAHFLNAQTPPLYISNATHDHFGFYSGTKRFASIAQQRGVQITYEEVEGYHCQFDADTLGAFLTQRDP